jgi:DNA-binding MarR family transcriptional regulator
MDRLSNLLGAQALALTDRLLSAQGEGKEALSASERSALVTLYAHPDHPVSWLGGVLELTSSGVTRLVDRLVEQGWVSRVAGVDARSRQVRLTTAGRRRARTILETRRAAMTDVVDGLSQRDRDELDRLLEQLVGSLADTRLPAMQVCRLCDRRACVAGDRECPLQHTVSGAADG